MIYLDNAATTFPKPKAVTESVYRCMTEYCANPGRGSHKMAIEGAKEIYDARELISQFFNLGNPMRVIFTSNATDSLNIGIKGFLKPGDHVITTQMEHNSVLRPLHELSNKGVEVTIVDCDSEGKVKVEDIENSIKSNTALIVTTHVSNLTGTIFPIKEIGEVCKKHNLKYLLDASQSAGVIEIDMKENNIHMLAAPGHKGLLGPQGTGILLVDESVDLDTIKEGGTGSDSSKPMQPKFYPDRLESGTPNLPGIVGLKRGIEYILSKGIKSIYSHEKNLLDLFINELQKIDKIKIYGPKDCDLRSGVVPINVEGIDSSEVSFILDDEFDIATRPGVHCAPLAHKAIGTEKIGAVRFSVGPFNTEEDILAAVHALKEIAGRD